MDDADRTARNKVCAQLMMQAVEAAGKQYELLPGIPAGGTLPEIVQYARGFLATIEDVHALRQQERTADAERAMFVAGYIAHGMLQAATTGKLPNEAITSYLKFIQAQANRAPGAILDGDQREKILAAIKQKAQSGIRVREACRQLSSALRTGDFNGLPRIEIEAETIRTYWNNRNKNPK